MVPDIAPGETRIVVSTTRRRGLKAMISMVPGAMVLHRLLKNLRHWSNSRRATVGGIKRADMTAVEAAAYTESIYRKIDKVVGQSGGWAGKHILEIGPGDSLGTGMWCLGAGAASYTAIDRFSVALDKSFEAQVSAAIRERMPPEEWERFQNALAGPATPDQIGERFVYQNDLPIEVAPAVLGHSCFDFIFSNAVLEHVADLQVSLSAMRELLVPGGGMFHDVDLRSHQTFERHPLQFLEYSPRLWSLMSSHNGEPNRVRMPGYLELLGQLGFGEIETGVSQVFDEDLIAEKRSGLAPEFRNLSPAGLRPAVFWFVCRRSG